MQPNRESGEKGSVGLRRRSEAVTNRAQGGGRGSRPAVLGLPARVVPSGGGEAVSGPGRGQVRPTARRKPSLMATRVTTEDDSEVVVRTIYQRSSSVGVYGSKSF